MRHPNINRISPLHAVGTVFLAAILAFSALVIPTRPARAFSISPPVIELLANPGENVTQAVKVQNDADAPISITVEKSNFTYKKGDEVTGTPELYPPQADSGPYGLAQWMSIVSASVKLAAGEKANVLFEIKVPKNADPGSHFGAVVMNLSAEDGRTAGVGVVGKVAALVILRVNGPAIEKLEVTGFDTDRNVYAHLPVAFEFRTENKGTVHARPIGSITVTDLFGRVAAVVPVNVEGKSVLPESARRYQATWTKPGLDDAVTELKRQYRGFGFGRYVATLEARYGENNERIVAKAAFWVFPWLLIIFVLGGIVAAATGLYLWSRWYAAAVIKRYEGKKGADGAR